MNTVILVLMLGLQAAQFQVRLQVQFRMEKEPDGIQMAFKEKFTLYMTEVAQVLRIVHQGSSPNDYHIKVVLVPRKNATDMQFVTVTAFDEPLKPNDEKPTTKGRPLYRFLITTQTEVKKEAFNTVTKILEDLDSKK